MKGDLYWVDFFGIGHQQQGIRPALIIQSDFINGTAIGTTLICPLTTAFRGLRSRVQVQPSSQNGLKLPSEVICEQISVIDKSTVLERMGEISAEELGAVEEALLFVLDIDR